MQRVSWVVLKYSADASGTSRIQGTKAAQAVRSPDGRDLALSLSEEVEVVDQTILHFLARDDGIDEAMFDKELRGLKARRQLGLSGVLDHARAGEADHRARFGDDQVAEAGVTGHYAGGGRMREIGRASCRERV